MSSRSYGYNVSLKRLRVVSWAELVILLSMIAVVCWMIFPRELSHSLRNARLDAVTLSYMQAWLEAKPDDYDLRLLMAKQLIQVGQYKRASQQLNKVAAANLSQHKRRLQWLYLQRDFNALMSLEPDQRRSSPLWLNTSQALLVLNWNALSSEQQQRYALMALILGFEKRAAQTYTLLALDAENPEIWYQKAGDTRLAHGHYAGAADAYQQAMGVTRTPVGRKKYFLMAINTLEAGTLHAQALTLAERHEGEFYSDDAVLFRLLKLAQAAGASDKAQHYAARLLNLADEDGESR